MIKKVIHKEKRNGWTAHFIEDVNIYSFTFWNPRGKRTCLYCRRLWWSSLDNCIEAFHQIIKAKGNFILIKNKGLSRNLVLHQIIKKQAKTLKAKTQSLMTNDKITETVCPRCFKYINSLELNLGYHEECQLQYLEKISDIIDSQKIINWRRNKIEELKQFIPVENFELQRLSECEGGNHQMRLYIRFDKNISYNGFITFVNHIARDDFRFSMDTINSYIYEKAKFLGYIKKLI